MSEDSTSTTELSSETTSDDSETGIDLSSSQSSDITLSESSGSSTSEKKENEMIDEEFDSSISGFQISKWENSEYDDYSNESSGFLSSFFSRHRDDEENEEEGYTPFIDDVLGVIFSFLQNRDLYRISWVSRQFKRISNKDMLWKIRVQKFQIPRFLDDRNRVKKAIVRSGKLSKLTFRDIYFELSFPFRQSEGFITELQQTKECDFASDSIQCMVPVITYLLFTFSVFLLILKVEKIGSSYPISTIGAILSFSLCFVLYLLEILSIIRILIYYRIGLTSGSYRKAQESMLTGRNEIDRRKNSVLLAIDYFTIYGYYTISLSAFWGSYKLWCSIPCIMFLLFANQWLEGYTLFIFGLWVATYVFGSFIRYMLMSRVWRVCIFQKGIWRKKRYYDVDTGMSAWENESENNERIEKLDFSKILSFIDVWRNYYFLNDFISGQIHTLLLYLQFFLYIRNERGLLWGGEDGNGYIFVIIIPVINFVVILILYILRFIISISLDAYNAVYIFGDHQVRMENTPLVRFVSIFCFIACFECRGVKRFLDTASESLPLLFSPPMLMIMYLLNFQFVYIIVFIPVAILVAWGCPFCYIQTLYLGGKLGTLLELEKGLWNVTD